MNIIDIIENKKNKKELTKQEISFFISGYTKNEIPDYQISALLMAIRLNSMSEQEIVFLTEEMVNSGHKITYEKTGKIIVDKHSTGGVGDKTSLVLIPLLASLGFGVSKMSGRALGITGGTLDKLEAIKGFDIQLKEEELIEQVKTIGCAIIGQTQTLVPADKKLYALRDVTATVDSIPLIASSIMSKKIALGADVIILDVKYGLGAFMQTKEEAQLLASKMCMIGTSLGKKTIACITSMNQPLGKNIGNSLEVAEAIDVMENNTAGELKELCSILAKEVMKITSDKIESEIEAMIESKFASKEVYKKFEEMMIAQNADFDALGNIKIATKTYVYKSMEKGYVESLNAKNVAKSAMFLGAARETKDEEIDLEVGVVLNKKIADEVNVGETLAILYYNDETNLELAKEEMKNAFKVSNVKKEVKLIEKIIN